jgi:probable F420-dependent oxidoreductase
MVVVLPYRNPFFTAHQVSTLDRLSGGRLILGVGTGYLRGEFRAAGADFDNRLSEFDEAVQVLTEGWSAKEIVRRGRHFDARGTVMQPQPVQHPHPPLWIHGNSRWGIERAARYGDGWLINVTTETLARTIRTAHVPDLVAVRARLEMLRAAMDRSGRDRADVQLAIGGVLPMLDIRTGWDAAKVRDDVAELSELGIDWITCNVIGDDPAASEDTVRRFGEEVVQAAG